MINYYKFKQVYEYAINGKHEEALKLLIELQQEFIEIHDENNKLRLHLQDVQDTLFFSKNLHFDRNSYWFHHTDGKKGPFCKHCYELRGILSYIDNHKELCSTCGASVKKNTDPTLIKKNNCKKIIPFPQNVTN
ncbi:hypothetical protein K9U34_02435 [Lawsonia intracellularis]|uniref:Uncharacterized protein n=1 Tax=Lawsonia intracellularis (strain PHE/MN1-00) TaxID=363253 RepID=Q1MS73_LAWIP|nr:hypothetical protein [Lawsonia intracellularis]AGC49496.1 hypothetical protein LAW_00095 [Lawsonia intracellularis N343]KAA0205017.1 hypothetical protein C4K43_00715 [Lawsonia intracellularis]MBZ3892457.1 hypothetical protein [Lawsonia intracellularis]OMQ06158.1 hypothetical protein BW722_00550 [Lawsonia intracellularis]RBN32434.1 hypothetical protein DR194_05660 [Lawsonia intracellularis]